MVKISIKQVIGRAGTGKTTYAKRVAEYHIKRRKTVYCLSFTHSAVENMRRRGFHPSCQFSTLHSFFRIDYNDDTVMGCYKPFDVLIIDEFSLIASSLMDNCLKSIYRNGASIGIVDCEVYLVGDPLQLGAVNGSDSISYSLLDTVLDIIPYSTIDRHTLTRIIRHWSRLCVNSTLVRELTTNDITLTTNHRSADSVTELVESVVMNGDYTKILPLLRTSDEVVRLVRDEHYTVLSSKYDVLKIINQRVRLMNALDYHGWKFISDESVYMTVNTGRLYNGQHVTLLTADNSSVTLNTPNGKDIITDIYIRTVDGNKLNDKIPIVMPAYLYTFHKAQGLEFNNVAICIDDLFEFPMLYTGITRARKNVVFFTMNSLFISDLESILNAPFNHGTIKMLSSITAPIYNDLNGAIMRYVNGGTEEMSIIRNIYEHSDI